MRRGEGQARDRQHPRPGGSVLVAGIGESGRRRSLRRSVMNRFAGLIRGRSRSILAAALAVGVVAINGFVLANLLDLIRALFALASLLLVVSAIAYSLIAPFGRHRQSTGPPASSGAGSLAIGAVITINVLFVLAAALGVVTLVTQNGGPSRLLREPMAGQLVYRVWGTGPSAP